MASAVGLIVNHRFTYRDDATEEWSTKYWLTGTPPVDTPGWQALFDKVAEQELPLFPNSTKVVGGIGYDDDTEGAHAVWTVDYGPTGGIAGSYLIDVSERKMSGDQAGLIQWRTNRKNARGKWIYLRKYFHDGALLSSDPDEMSGGWKDKANAFALKFFDGTFEGGRKIRSQKQVEDLASHGAAAYVTTRTLKRRGKRP